MAAEFFHQAGLIPLLVTLLLRHRAEPEHWFLALAFAVSWLGDFSSFALDGSWAPSFFWIPVQIYLAAVALGDRVPNRTALRIALAGLVLPSILISWPGPEVLMTVAGSLALLWFVTTGKPSPIGWPVFIYFGLGSVAYLLMVGMIGGSGFLGFWCVYQSIRLASFGVFALLVFHRHPDKLGDV